MSTLDDLHLQYLNTIDTYQAHARQISEDFANGFISLAAANVGAPPPGGGRYGRGQFEYKTEMKARWGVRIVAAPEEEGGMVWEGVDFEAAEEGEVEAVKGVEEGRQGEGLRRRRGKQEEPEPELEPETKLQSETPEPQPKTKTQPLTLFHPLPPSALRTAAAAFTTSLTTLPALATTLYKLQTLSSLISHTHVYKLLPTPPQFPLPLSKLDQESGYIHLCTPQQAPGVAERFMGECKELWVLKVSLEVVGGEVRWEEVGGERFPHLYGTLEREAVEEVGRVEKDGWGEIEWEEM